MSSVRGNLLQMRTQAPAQLDAIMTVAPEVGSVPQVRHQVRDYAASLMAQEQLANLELALTEVVANSVRHSNSGDSITVALTPKDGYLCVRVTDGGTGLVPRPGAMATDPGAGPAYRPSRPLRG